MAYTATVDDMLANAYNNWRRHHVDDKVSVVPRPTYEKYADHYKKLEQRSGFKTLPLDTVTHAELLAAMEWYEQHTDWSAFKRERWQAALDSLGSIH